MCFKSSNVRASLVQNSQLSAEIFSYTVVAVAFLYEVACSRIFFIFSNYSPKCKQNASLEYQNNKKNKTNTKQTNCIFVCFLSFILRVQYATCKTMWKLRTTGI